ncbi:MAG: ABC transporter substrate-binding protein [Chloroflexota bacterium]
MSGRKLFSTIVAIALALSLVAGGFGCAKATPAVTQWEVPVFVAMTGPLAFLGEDIQWAMNRAATEINAAGGIRGKPVKLTYYDSPYDAARAVTLTREQADKALVIAAQVTGVEAEAAAPVAVTAKVPWIDAITNASTTFEKNRPWTFGLSTDPGASAGAALKRLLADNPQVKTVGRLMEVSDQIFLIEWNGMKPVLEAAGIKEVAVAEHKIGDIEFSAAVTKIKAANPDLVLLLTAPGEGGRFVAEMAKQGMPSSTKLTFATEDFIGPEAVSAAGAALEGVYVGTATFNALDEAKWQAFYQAYLTEKKATTMAYWTPVAYDTLYVIKHAMEKAQVTGDKAKLATEREAIRAELEKLKDFPGINGVFSMGSGGWPFKTAYLLKFQGGDFVKVAAAAPK